MGTILTIGYEGATIRDFVATLGAAGVQILVDIRDVPVSRKRGFSKKALAGILASEGTGYVHLRALGNPKPGREAARRGDMETFRRIFQTHMAGASAQDALAQALDLAAQSRICLLCFERDPAGCHRGIVAGEMARRAAIRVRHLVVRPGAVRPGMAGEADHGDFNPGFGNPVGQDRNRCHGQGRAAGEPAAR